MNLPNRLTVFRIILSPIFLVLLLWDFDHHYLAALGVFVFASVTDLVDGILARKNNQITDFGKFLDPLADKLLTTAAYLGFIYLDVAVGAVYIAMIVLAREFLVTSIRLVAAADGSVIAANVWGKAKTVSQMTAIIVTILSEYLISLDLFTAPWEGYIRTFNSVLLWISALLAVISGVIYLVNNRKLVNVKK